MEQKAIVESPFSGKNFGAHVPQLAGCVATGKTPGEVKQKVKEAIEFHLEDGDPVAKAFRDNYGMVYKFDPPGFFNYYKGIFTNAALERITGINPKQLQHYASGLKKPRPAQAKKIETALHHLGSELMAVNFSVD